MNIIRMSKADFEQVPRRISWDEPVMPFYSLVIIPEGTMHDSGFMNMSFVACDHDNSPIVRMSGCSDVLYIDGLGGFGDWRNGGSIPKTRPIQEWRIDCLPCGYLRLFCRGKITCGTSTSDFEIFWNSNEPAKEKEIKTDEISRLWSAT